MNARITTKEVPAELLHTEGKNKGSLNQDVLQINGINLVCGTVHPLCENIVFVQMDHARGRQVWTTKSRFLWRRMRNAKHTLGQYHKKKKASK